MRMIKTILAAAMFFVCGMATQAQECSNCKEAQDLGYKPYPYGFVQLQGGVGTTFTDVNFTDLLSPTASVGFGYWFNSGVGARLHFNAWESKGGFNKWNNGSTALETYKYNYATGNFDLMLNLTNFISKKCNHKFNLILIGGVGLNYAWNNDDLQGLLANPAVAPLNSTSNAWGEGTTREHLLNHNLRAGLLFDVNVAKHWNVGVEVDANSLDDRFNSKYSDRDDWMVTAQLSLTYKFGFKKPCAQKPAPVPAPVVAPTPVPEPVVAPKPEPTPAPVVETPKPVETAKPAVVEEPIKETIFYAIRESDVDNDAKINKVVEWCKKYPNKTINVSGYADKGTGNATLNKGYSEKRANKVVETLKSKGVPASQIKSAAYGDSVQPFAENDKNRCVIIEGK